VWLILGLDAQPLPHLVDSVRHQAAIVIVDTGRIERDFLTRIAGSSQFLFGRVQVKGEGLSTGVKADFIGQPVVGQFTDAPIPKLLNDRRSVNRQGERSAQVNIGHWPLDGVKHDDQVIPQRYLIEPYVCATLYLASLIRRNRRDEIDLATLQRRDARG